MTSMHSIGVHRRTLSSGSLINHLHRPFLLDDMAKPNLPVVIFLQVLVTQVIAWVGKSFLQDVAFAAYSKFILGSNARKQRELRKQVLIDKAELAKTSSQDEFAKWARLKRKLDKGLGQLEKESECRNDRRRILEWRGTIGTGARGLVSWHLVQRESLAHRCEPGCSEQRSDRPVVAV